jgi:hypothetical protein
MNLKKLLETLQNAYDKHKDNPQCADNLDVEFWIGEEMYEVERIGQFEIVPDVTISLKRLNGK